jgi:aspartate carbamoyltransferase catalytic subunit
MHLSEVSWDAFQKLSLKDKGPYCMLDGREFHVLVAQQFDRNRLDRLGELATCIRLIAKGEEGMNFLQRLLSHKRAMLYFTQPSTRTFLSFCAACQILGITVGEVRDRATSSEFKGESQEDSVRTFSSYFDMIVMRTEVGGLAERMAWALSNTERPVPIINAGSGKDQHPTQALLDIYTLQRSFENRGGIDGKRIVFVGDLARGRTVRSLSSLLTNYDGVSQWFVAPEQLQMTDDILKMLKDDGVECKCSDNFREAIPEADAVYMTRVQDEWDEEKGQSSSIDISQYWFTAEHLKLMKPDAVIMHPLPRRREISTDVDHDPRAVYWRQMRNGMWIRAALIATIFGCDQVIHDYYRKNV